MKFGEKLFETKLLSGLFAVFFPLPSGCVIKFTKSECLRNSSLSFTLTFSLSSAVTSRQVLVSAFTEKLFSRTVVLHPNSLTNLFSHFLIER